MTYKLRLSALAFIGALRGIETEGNYDHEDTKCTMGDFAFLKGVDPPRIFDIIRFNVIPLERAITTQGK